MFSLFDCHCDTITTAMREKQDIYDNSLHISLKRLQEFKRAVQVFAIWLDDDLIDDGFKNANSAIDFFESCLNKHGDILVKATNEETLAKCNEGKIAAILSVEGGEAIGDSLDNTDYLYGRGVRLATLTWNRENNLGYGAQTGSKKPLKPFGIQALKRMEKLGIIVDVSHLNEAGFWSVCENSAKPFIASHSNAKSLCRHYRNLTDEQLKAMRASGSMVGINLFPPFLNESETACIDDILRHTEYMGNIIGEDRLCLGCDFDGIDKTPRDIHNVSELDKLYNAFINSFGKSVADKIFFENIYEFMRDFII
jgi:membrane dipeptidase